MQAELLALESDRQTCLFDDLTMGILLFDENGTIILQNKAASRILRENDGLISRDHRVHALDRHENAQLQALIRRALGKIDGLASQTGGQMLVMRRSLRHPYMVFVSSLRSSPIVIESRNAIVAVYITDPEPRVTIEEEVLRRLYGLTSSEARLTALLVEGKNVEEASEKLEITTNTTRTHLKNIFKKTSTRSQSDLIRLVMSGLAVVFIA